MLQYDTFSKNPAQMKKLLQDIKIKIYIKSES